MFVVTRVAEKHLVYIYIFFQAYIPYVYFIIISVSSHCNVMDFRIY